MARPRSHPPSDRGSIGACFCFRALAALACTALRFHCGTALVVRRGIFLQRLRTPENRRHGENTRFPLAQTPPWFSRPLLIPSLKFIADDVLWDRSGRERRDDSRSPPPRYRKRRRSRSPSSSPPRRERSPARKHGGGSEDKDGAGDKVEDGKGKKAEEEEAAAAAAAEKKPTKAKKPKGSKLFKQPKKDGEDGGGGKGGKATTGSVEFWNDERAKLGLKPLK